MQFLLMVSPTFVKQAKFIKVIPKQNMTNPIQNKERVIIVKIIKFMNQKTAVRKFTIQKQLLFTIFI